MLEQTQEPRQEAKEEVHPSWKRILVVEDDTALANFLKRGLHSQQYAVDVLHDGETALRTLYATPCDLLLLDLTLPGLDGLTLLDRLRPTMPNLPVLVLTGRAALEDRVTALDHGADDCILKPFSFNELAARIRALLRRNSSNRGKVIKVSDLTMDREHFQVERSGRRIDLTEKEFSLLEYLMVNARRTVTRSMIMENVWKSEYNANSNLVDVYIKYVRDKIDGEGSSPKLLRTMRGVGYVIADN
jgi:two-component system, OmpR family, copper resistance phosphate regulon response regulator CusR